MQYIKYYIFTTNISGSDTMALIGKYSKTNLFIMDENLWTWTKYRAEVLGFKSVAEYIFQLIKLDKEKDLIKK